MAVGVTTIILIVSALLMENDKTTSMPRPSDPQKKHELAKQIQSAFSLLVCLWRFVEVQMREHLGTIANTIMISVDHCQ